MQQKQPASRPDAFEPAAITPEVIDEAIRRSQRLRSEAVAAGLASLGHAISRVAGKIWHAAGRRHALPSGSGLKPAQRPCP